MPAPKGEEAASFVMSGTEAAWVPGFDSVMGIFTLPLWMWLAGAGAALLVIFAGRAFVRISNSPAIAALPQYALVAIALFFAWSFLDRSMTHDRLEARRALDARATALTAQVIAAGSALSCLDAGAGEAVEAACEKALFSTPETVAAAVSYVGAKLGLLAEAVELAKNDDSDGLALIDLRRTIEADRFGVAAHVLTSRDRCTAERCDSFRLIPDRRQITAHMKEDSFGQYVARHAANWPANNAQPAVAANAPPDKEKATTAVAPSNWNFPSAASIPPVSIMNPEPSGPPGLPPGAVVPEPTSQPPPPVAAAPPPASASPAPTAAAQPARKPALPPKRNPQGSPTNVQAAPLPAPTPPAPRANAAPAAAAAPLNTTPAIQ